MCQSRDWVSHYSGYGGNATRNFFRAAEDELPLILGCGVVCDEVEGSPSQQYGSPRHFYLNIFIVLVSILSSINKGNSRSSQGCGGKLNAEKV